MAKKTRFSSARIIILSFILVITVGTLLLHLPVSTKSGKISLTDALFTSTSAVCVTGLIVQDTGSYFTIFGQTVILILIQLGGLGIMSFSVIFLVLLKKKMSARNKLLIKDSFNIQTDMTPKQVFHYILLFTFTAEIIGAIIFYSQFKTHYPFKSAVFYSVFHSVSSFCNAGFSTFTDSFTAYASNSVMMFNMTSLIIIGGLGIVALTNIRGSFEKFKFNKLALNLHSKTVLWVTLILIILGTLFFFIFEYDGVLKGGEFNGQFLKSYFQSVTARTAGFNTVDMADLKSSTLLLIMALMFIGGSTGSTAGGIKTTTFAVVFFTFLSIIKGKGNVEAFKRVIPPQIVQKALAIFFVAVMVALCSLFILLLSESGNSLIAGDNFFLKVLFEVISAFGTVGLSMGITADLTALGKLIITLTMFIGRLGALTLAVGMIDQKKYEGYKYPEEDIFLG